MEEVSNPGSKVSDVIETPADSGRTLPRPQLSPRGTIARDLASPKIIPIQFCLFVCLFAGF